MKFRFQQYEHHQTMVWVREDLRGKHREHCLCWGCRNFYPGESNNCKIAQAVFENCVKFDIVTPMWECPNFVEAKS